MLSVAAMAGAAMGVGIQVMANALQKLPVTRAPYMHVFCAGIFGYGIDYMVTQTEQMKVIVAKAQQEKMEKSHSF